MNLTVGTSFSVGQLSNRKSIANQDNRYRAALRFGTTQKNSVLSVVSWGRKIFGAVLGVGIVAGTFEYFQYREDTRQKAARQVEAQKAEKAAEHEKQWNDVLKNVVKPAYAGKVLARRTPTQDPLKIRTSIQDDDFVDLYFKADWQVIPGSELAQRAEKLIEQEMEFHVNKILYSGSPHSAGAIADYRIKQYLDGDIHDIIANHATGFLKKHKLQAWTQQPKLLERFKKDFFEGGEDFEGKQRAGIKAVLENAGVQLHSLELDSLKAVWDRIVLPFNPK